MTFIPYSEDRWFSPKYIIESLFRANGKADSQTIKHLKEAWIAAVALIGRSVAQKGAGENNEWWIQIPKNDPPDVLGAQLSPLKEGSAPSLSVLPIEVFEISEHSIESVFTSIKRKLDGKDYSGMLVVGFIKRASAFQIDILAKRIADLKPKLGALHLIFAESPSAKTERQIMSLYPPEQVFKYPFDFGVICKQSQQQDFIDLSRSTKLKKKEINATYGFVAITPKMRPHIES